MRRKIFLWVCIFTLIGVTDSYAFLFSKTPDEKILSYIEDYRKDIEKYEKEILKIKNDKIENQAKGKSNLKLDEKEKQEKADIKQKLNKRRDGYVPLYYAIIKEDVDLVDKMLQYGANPNEFYIESHKVPLLYIAIEQKINSESKKILSLLISNNYRNVANLSYKLDVELDGGGYKNLTPLFYACRRIEDTEIISQMITKTDEETIKSFTTIYEDDDGISSEYHQTPLALMCSIGNYRENKVIIEQLIKSNPDMLHLESTTIFHNVDGPFSYTTVPLETALQNDEITITEKIELCTLLLENGANPNYKCTLSSKNEQKTYTPFHTAVQQNNIELYKLFEKNGGNKNIEDYEGKTVLDYRSEQIENIADQLQFSYEESNSAEVFLKRNGGSWENFLGDYKIKTSDTSELNLAQIAINNEDDKNAKEILNHIDWTDENAAGENALDMALKKRRDDVINFIIEEKINKLPPEADKIKLIGDSIFNVIKQAVDDGNISYLEKILTTVDFRDQSIRLSSNTSDYEGNIFTSCGLFIYTTLVDGKNFKSQNRIRILEILLEKGYDINETGTGSQHAGANALILAAKYKNKDVVEFLIEKGIDVNKQIQSSKYSGRSAIFYALENKDKHSYSSILNASNYELKDIHLSNTEDQNKTFLMFLARYGDFETMKDTLPLLLNKDPSCLERKDSNGYTPFLHAAQYNADYKIMKVLRMYGANVYAQSNDNESAYHLAAGSENKNQEKLSRLNDYGVYE